MHCTVGHSGNGTAQPTVVWVKDGVPLEADGDRIVMHIIPPPFEGGMSENVLIINQFQLSDIGMYQCIFVRPDGNQEILASVPFRLDGGW